MLMLPAKVTTLVAASAQVVRPHMAILSMPLVAAFMLLNGPLPTLPYISFRAATSQRTSPLETLIQLDGDNQLLSSRVVATSLRHSRITTSSLIRHSAVPGPVQSGHRILCALRRPRHATTTFRTIQVLLQTHTGKSTPSRCTRITVATLAHPQVAAHRQL
jgi:hypothetical protein